MPKEGRMWRPTDQERSQGICDLNMLGYYSFGKRDQWLTPDLQLTKNHSGHGLRCLLTWPWCPYISRHSLLCGIGFICPCALTFKWVPLKICNENSAWPTCMPILTLKWPRGGGFLGTQDLFFAHFTTFASVFFTVIFSNCLTIGYASFDAKNF